MDNLQTSSSEDSDIYPVSRLNIVSNIYRDNTDGKQYIDINDRTFRLQTPKGYNLPDSLCIESSIDESWTTSESTSYSSKDLNTQSDWVELHSFQNYFLYRSCNKECTQFNECTLCADINGIPKDTHFETIRLDLFNGMMIFHPLKGCEIPSVFFKLVLKV